MASVCLDNTVSLSEARQLCAEARQLLQSLMASRDDSERRHLESGKRDPLKFVTGMSALDQAVASAQDMILTMETAIAELFGEASLTTSATLEPPIVEVRPSEQRRPRFRRSLRTAINASFRAKPVPAVS